VRLNGVRRLREETPTPGRVLKAARYRTREATVDTLYNHAERRRTGWRPAIEILHVTLCVEPRLQETDAGAR
jgi:hypothetical protein